MSGKLPINEMYGTGQSSIYLSKKEDSLCCNYEWNSGSSGGFYRANLTYDDSLVYTNNITVSLDNEMINYNETVNFITRSFSRKTEKFTNDGPLIIATDKKIAGLPFKDFIPIFGKQNIKNRSDLSAAATITYSKSEAFFSIDVQDDFLVFGKNIKSDHIELWWSDAVFEGELNTKPTEKTRQLLIFFDGTTSFCIPGYPENDSKIIANDITLKKTTTGYTVSFSVPLRILYTTNSFNNDTLPQSNNDGNIMLMTIIVSDTDESKKQESMIATSNLKWGNSSTFGRVALIKNGKIPVLSWNHFFQ